VGPSQVVHRGHASEGEDWVPVRDAEEIGAMMEKLCVFCKNFDWERAGYVYYSTLTGGDITGGTTCKKQHYFEVQPYSLEEFRKLILKAERCADYDPDIPK